jgi:hypothetical protein
MHGGRGADWSDVPGGRFSLGRLEDGSGYCVGSVVETRMGIKEERDEMMGGTQNELHTAAQRGGMGGNGMRDVWVIGEGFFRGVGGVFDVSSIRCVIQEAVTSTDTGKPIAQGAASRVSHILNSQRIVQISIDEGTNRSDKE